MRRVLMAAALLLMVLLAPVPMASAAPTARVHVIVCPTSLGVNNPPKPVASSATMPASAAHLVVYSTTSGYLQILGPRNLACQGGIGADGGANITAWSASSPNAGIGHGGVTAVVYPTCLACQLTLACPFFPAALRALRSQYSYLNCGSQPLGQIVRRLSADAVAFADPAGEYVSPHADSLVPSNSPYPANGVVVYDIYRYRGYRDSTTMGAVCVLPASEHAVCTAVLNEFLATQVRNFT